MINLQQIDLFRWFQISHAGDQLYSDTSPYKVPRLVFYASEFI